MTTMSILEAFAVPHPPILIPGVGRGEERDAQATLDAYRTVARRIAALAPETIILTTPHGDLRRNALRVTTGTSTWGDFSQFGDPTSRLEAALDEELIDALVAEMRSEGLPLEASPEPDSRLDHGCLVPLHFIAQELKTPFKIVRIGISFLDEHIHFRTGQCIARAVEKMGRRTVFVASGDLSHRLKSDGPYGFDPAGPVFDQALCEAFSAGDFDALMRFDALLLDGAGQCGLDSFIIMAGALDGHAVTPELLSYEGPWGVGYGIARFTPLPSLPVRLAFAALADWLEGTGEPSANSPHVAALLASLKGAGGGADADADAEADVGADAGGGGTDADVDVATDEKMLAELRSRRAGAFVSFHKGEHLRGCIGTISATCDNIFEEICQNTVSAAEHDPRFPAIAADEVPELHCSVDVLGEAEPVADISELDAKRYGVIVSKGFRRGLLLPDLEGVDTPQQQIAIALSKAGIAPDAAYELERFEVVRYT
jgi:AmmeMemoRadiSam system protein A/AmmeMemoRadiSam system protein B